MALVVIGQFEAITVPFWGLQQEIYKVLRYQVIFIADNKNNIS